MTSTVIDATVFLLCLSAGVGVLANAGAVGENVVAAPDAESVADVIAGSTATVEYRPTTGEDAVENARADDTNAHANGGNATATHHATLAELIARAAVLDANGSTENAAGYPAEVRKTVREMLRDLRGGRIRLTAFPSIGAVDQSPLVVGAEPASSSDVDVAVVTAPGSTENHRPSEGRGGVRIVVEVW